MNQLNNAWLRMDNETNLMQIVGVWQLAPASPPAQAEKTKKPKSSKRQRPAL